MKYADETSPLRHSARWRKSSYSGLQSNCVEVAHTASDSVPIRDSKHPGGPIILVPRPAWAVFLAHVRAGS
ncbi:hypothetical protein GCM10010218_47350 [Streptomyces mashuensis]|uniref:DUF397 domain-containing protein n=1 Tax=Streptomyces mashuensis TaxID=33904 RepID=A0A919B5N7_9ACTN|nr:DUF397 domain-containing protein [Streptomyces mashuensis]GHF60446.1 hypothetical protein GCM10010218_47350 [Streptomyces mashuensis]